LDALFLLVESIIHEVRVLLEVFFFQPEITLFSQPDTKVLIP